MTSTPALSDSAEKTEETTEHCRGQFKQYNNPEQKEAALREAVKQCSWDLVAEAIDTGLTEAQMEYVCSEFSSWCKNWELTDDLDMLEFVFLTASKLRKTELVMALLERCTGRNSEKIQQMAAEAAVDDVNWGLLEALVEREYAGTLHNTLFACLEKILKVTGSWQEHFLPFLSVFDNWCRMADEVDVEELLNSLRENMDQSLLSDTATWCCNHGKSLPDMALLFSVASRQTSLMRTVLERHGTDILDCFLETGFKDSLGYDLGTACSHLPYLSESTLDPDVFQGCASQLTLQCRKMGLRNWELFFAVHSGKLKLVKEAAKHHTDQNRLVIAAAVSASLHGWEIVKELLKKCPKATMVGYKEDILRAAVLDSEVEVVESLLEEIDPEELEFRDNSDDTILSRAVVTDLPRVGGREKEDAREQVVRACLRTGFATYQRMHDYDYDFDYDHANSPSPIRRAVEIGDLPLVRLLYDCGSASNFEIYNMTSNSVLTKQLYDDWAGDVYEFLQEAAENPCSLKHLCRLAVSHIVGCRPGRQERVASLPVPEHLRDYISFSDILS
ncbi:hypothetical protein BaRGS_00021522 [Batillaria attramentaria]|uniref:SOCS box domain-containing protein n=1 Tax=Batillaria attramentaria TaxID=370345 RepID=A0ABD0KJD7_9CAEN